MLTKGLQPEGWFNMRKAVFYASALLLLMIVFVDAQTIKTKIIQPAQFQADDSFTRYTINGGLSPASTTMNYYLAAVDLPQGSTIKKIKVYYSAHNINYGLTELKVILERHKFNGPFKKIDIFEWDIDTSANYGSSIAIKRGMNVNVNSTSFITLRVGLEDYSDAYIYLNHVEIIYVSP